MEIALLYVAGAVLLGLAGVGGLGHLCYPPREGGTDDSSKARPLCRHPGQPEL